MSYAMNLLSCIAHQDRQSEAKMKIAVNNSLRAGSHSCIGGYGVRAHSPGQSKTHGENNMFSLRPLSIAMLSALAFAPSAFAQDAGTTTGGDTASTGSTSNDSASGKRIAIVGGGAILQPDSDPLPGAR